MIRLDRLITLAVFHPLCRGNNPTGRCLPVLMYHSISDDAEPGIQPYYRTTTGPKQFAEQMRWLSHNGWQGTTLNEGLAWLASSATPSLAPNPPASEPRNIQPPVPELHPVAVTFDDGFRDFHTAAVPALRESGFRATMFLPTRFIGSERRSFKGRECLTWSEVERLHRDGFEFGSHTVNHPRLVDLPWPEITTELRDSRVEIEDHLGVAATHFAYPYAFPQAGAEFTSRFKATLAETGYTCCVTTRIGRARSGDDRLLLPRLPVNSADDASLLAAKLRGAYDWLAPVQSGFKRLKSALRGDRRRLN